MAKPIFIVKLTENLSHVIGTIGESLEQAMPDYHVLCIVGLNKEIEFQVFYEKDFEPLEFEKLKADVLKSIEQFKNKAI